MMPRKRVFFAKKPACKFTIIYPPPVLWKTMIVYICMTMEIKKWKLFISFLVLKTSKAEKNSSQPFGPSKKAIFSRQINPRRLGKPNGVHHELSRNRATGCSSKFLILQSSVFCPKLAWTPCRWSIGASVWDTWRSRHSEAGYYRESLCLAGKSADSNFCI